MWLWPVLFWPLPHYSFYWSLNDGFRSQRIHVSTTEYKFAIGQQELLQRVWMQTSSYSGVLSLYLEHIVARINSEFGKVLLQRKLSECFLNAKRRVETKPLLSAQKYLSLYTEFKGGESQCPMISSPQQKQMGVHPATLSRMLRSRGICNIQQEKTAEVLERRRQKHINAKKTFFLITPKASEQSVESNTRFKEPQMLKFISTSLTPVTPLSGSQTC